MDIDYLIGEIERYKQSHIVWADYFEKNPEIEKEYTSTGEWDDAKEHRHIIAVYDEVIDRLRK